MTLLTALGLAGVVFFIVVALAIAAFAVVNIVVKSATRGLYDEDEAA